MMTTVTGTLDLSRIPEEQFDPNFHLRVAVVFYDQVLGSAILKPVSRTTPLAFSVPFTPALFGFRRLPAALTVVVGAGVVDFDLLSTDTLEREVSLAGLVNASAEQLVIPVGDVRPSIAQYGRWLVSSGFFQLPGGLACLPPVAAQRRGARVSGHTDRPGGATLRPIRIGDGDQDSGAVQGFGGAQPGAGDIQGEHRGTTATGDQAPLVGADISDMENQELDPTGDEPGEADEADGALDADIAELESESARSIDLTIELEDDTPDEFIGEELSAEEQGALEVAGTETDVADDRGSREVRVASSCSKRPWYVAPSLLRLRAELNRRWPRRDKRSDGAIGDERHCRGPSDHNPNRRNSVNALDIDKDGIVPMIVVRALMRHPSTNYVIFNRTIWSRRYGFRPHRYTGANPHTAHIHVSIMQTRAAEQNRRGWRIWPIPKATTMPGDAMASVDSLPAAAEGSFNVGQTYDAMVTQGGKQFEVALTVLRESPAGQVLVS
ncbi:hypothetical protein [Massilia violaceinigra]|nr:hypothetical protein [Massilia violaceinigra]